MGCVGEDDVKSGPLESHLAADESGAIEAHSVQVEMKRERRGRMKEGGEGGREGGEIGSGRRRGEK